MRTKTWWVAACCLCLIMTLPVGDVTAGSRAKGRGAQEDNGDKVCLCHIPPGNPAAAHEICVGARAVRAHLAHGDTLDACPQDCGGPQGIECPDGQFCKIAGGDCGFDAEGECVDIPLTCPTIFNEVCGCDGVSYDNECYADARGVPVAYPGECDEAQSCGGDAGDTCDPGQFCRRPQGECGEDAEGVCADLPLNCPLVFAPVCGCDGVNYDNACEAAAAGVTVSFDGRCEDRVACGGVAGDTCAEGQFCKREFGECADDAEGVCTEVPAMCPAQFDPVCGCDGESYANTCMADGAAVTVAAEGECEDVRACGGEAGDSCAEGQYCRTAGGECGDDAEGECVDLPTECPLVLDPVCGCDGTSYDNACEAAGAGVNVAYAGECVDERVCGGTAGDTCDAGQFCKAAVGECAVDAEGVCTDLPVECPQVLDPVCGCDETTYANACAADAAGVNVAATGECAG